MILLLPVTGLTWFGILSYWSQGQENIFPDILGGSSSGFDGQDRACGAKTIPGSLSVIIYNIDKTPVSEQLTKLGLLNPTNNRINRTIMEAQ